MIPEAASFCTLAALIVGDRPEVIWWHKINSEPVVLADRELTAALGHDDAVSLLAWVGTVCERIAMDGDSDALALMAPAWAQLVEVCPPVEVYWLLDGAIFR